MPSKLGQRYKCEVCGTEVLSTKVGEGTLTCCDQEMKVQEPNEDNTITGLKRAAEKVVSSGLE